MSELGRREKWTGRSDYRDTTIAKALELVTETYQPGGVVRHNGRVLNRTGPIPAPAPADTPPRAALEACVTTFRRWLHMPDPGHLLIALATVVANRADGDPVWTLITAPPSGGKTEALVPLAAAPEVRMAATLTEASLLSGVPKGKRVSGSKGG